MSEENSAMETEPPQELDDSDVSSNSSDENDQEQILTQRAEQLELDIADNKYLYESHVELVGIYKKLGELRSLREAFQRFHEYFPLTPALWMEWINVEKCLATTDKQKEFIIQLFDQAVEDYLSVELWSEYAQYAVGATNFEKTRIVLERGINIVGLVCNGGGLLWATYREIENAQISLFEEGSEEWKRQVQKLADVFKRELSVPLLEMDSTYAEWKQWSSTFPEGLIDAKPVEYGYTQAKKRLDIYKPFEDQLLATQSNEELLETYNKYINAVKDPSTVICIFERAASQLCLVPAFWLDYGNYVFKLGDQALSVCRKALRNCPWSEELWIFKLRVLENLKKKDGTVLECFEEAILSISPNPGLELWLAYLEYYHRVVGSTEKLDTLFNQAIHQLGLENDSQCKVSRFFTRILAQRGAIKDARKIWGQIIKSPNKSFSIFWLEFANLEKQYGEPQALRSLFQKALKEVQDQPQWIIDEWLLYERHCGTLDDVMKCTKKCSEILSQSYQNVQYKSDAITTSQATNNTEARDKGIKRKMRNEDTETKRMKKEKPKPQEKPKELLKPKPPVEKNPKTTVFVSNMLPGVSEDKLQTVFPNAAAIEIARDRKGKSRCFGYVEFKTEEEVMVALARDREPLDGRPIFISEVKASRTERKPIFKYATNEEKNKLFVRGLPIKKSKEEIQEIFQKYGAKDVRLVLHKSGQPKGLAYIEFESEQQAKAALKQTDQMNIDEHVITVAISAPPPKNERQMFGGSFEKKNDEEQARHPKSRLQTSLLPRSLQMKGTGENKEQAKNGQDGAKMKSNSEFRAMLLNKLD
ncbi:squamous cell carcinoma antigen recognized by T-cells 3 [Dendroctonus ponderosae]|uniref:squamous cell carcinoma antigen recognized by T-cells 3 n=1 Tax=Dendroctonus ponderosae TaxID=77166 RepID=UPI00203641BE|nr:squamous cell carcinoma antigen recognized by T-cells 3 [Dendroctonus ponderosae]KAH1015492.1 hypothetical protein HUJ05_013207 [Dendroctonus ponderosae]